MLQDEAVAAVVQHFFYVLWQCGRLVWIACHCRLFCGLRRESAGFTSWAR